MKQDWNLGDLVDPCGDIVLRKLTKLFVNMKGDSSWTTGPSQNEQFIALTTQIEELKKDLAAQKGATAVVPTDAGTGIDKVKRPYTVKPWRLVYEGNVVMVAGRICYWCTKDHWSGGVKYNGIYYQHTT